jgi:hypothetical protein
LTAYAPEGYELVSIEPPGWEISKAAGPLVWRDADSSTDGYHDIEADITKEGVRKLHEHGRGLLDSHVRFFEADLKRRSPDDPYRQEEERQLKRVLTMLSTLDDLVSDKTPSDVRFVICVFEWESGLGD